MWRTILLVIFWCIIHRTAESHCGRSVNNEVPSGARKDRIVGGYDMGYYKYPWYVALIKDNIVGCGGSLINSRTILTAAHCFRSIEKSKLEVYYTIKLGIYNICTSEHSQVEFKAEKVKIHDLYNKKNPYYDIAVITLDKDASQFTPICLPSQPITKRPREGLVAGLGVLKYEGATPCTLHETRLLIQSDEECISMLNKVEKNVSHIIKAFCAGYIQGGVDTCQGDSGGPLQITGSDGEYTLLGIVSFGYKCASPGVLGLYTDVSQHLDWIKKNAAGDFTHNHDNDTSENETEVSTSTESTSSSESSTFLPLQPPQYPPQEAPQYPPQQAPHFPVPASIPLPSIGMRPNQFLHFYPFRPVNAMPPRPNQPPINIFIFNKRKSKDNKHQQHKKTNNEELPHHTHKDKNIKKSTIA